MKKLPKVLVGCPTSHHKSYCLKEYLEGIKSLTYPNFDVLLVENSENNEYFDEIKKNNLPVIKGPYQQKARDRIIASRNMLRRKAIDEGYDYFLSLEQDVIPDKDIIEKLLKHNKKIVSAVVIGLQDVHGEVMPAPMLYIQSKVNPDTIWFLDPAEIKKPQCIEINNCALGCVLIHRDVLEKIRFRYEGGFDDMIFCKDSRENGFKIYADTTARTTHLQREYWGTVEK